MLEIRPDRPREGSRDLKTLWGRAGHMYNGCPDWLLVAESPGPGQCSQQLGPSWPVAQSLRLSLPRYWVKASMPV